MGSAHKKPYHHGSLRDTLLQAAAELTRERGVRGFSMRELARRAQVSPAAPYRHFANNDALLDALGLEAQERFMQKAQAALARCDDDPLDRLKAYGVALVLFAADNPTFFELRGSFAVAEEESAGKRATRQVLAELGRNLQLAINEGKLRGDDPATLMFAMQSLAYGIGYLAAQGRLAEFGIAREGLEEKTRAVMKMMDEGLCGICGADGG